MIRTEYNIEGCLACQKRTINAIISENDIFFGHVSVSVCGHHVHIHTPMHFVQIIFIFRISE